MDCRVVLEAAIPVYDVEARDAAVRIAIAKTGTMLNPALSYVEITAATRSCPQCGAAHTPAFVAANEALVALELELDVFTVENEQHAERIALAEIGQRLNDIPLTVAAVSVLADTNDE